jgi:hypothetical protein
MTIDEAIDEAMDQIYEDVGDQAYVRNVLVALTNQAILIEQEAWEESVSGRDQQEEEDE